ncbi:hypothetical protein HSE3_gp013 [Bacillus phage vB_BceM-HSE3]|nr:hypothetical protein HSE3_gp013 [Bacillus phage vB_BceM-HSE3]
MFVKIRENVTGQTGIACLLPYEEVKVVTSNGQVGEFPLYDFRDSFTVLGNATDTFYIQIIKGINGDDLVLKKQPPMISAKHKKLGYRAIIRFHHNSEMCDVLLPDGTIRQDKSTKLVSSKFEFLDTLIEKDLDKFNHYHELRYCH